MTYIYGIELWHFYVFRDVTCKDVLKWALIGGFLGSIPVSLSNIYVHYRTPRYVFYWAFFFRAGQGSGHATNPRLSGFSALSQTITLITFIKLGGVTVCVHDLFTHRNLQWAGKVGMLRLK